jgi:serine/threonine protein kinase
MSSVTDPTSTPDRSAPELPPHLLSKLKLDIPGYTLVSEIASGGQATVWRATELTSGLTVAIKVLRAGPFADPVARERFRREMLTLQAINHPNIVTVIQSGTTPAGLDFLVMNYVEGRTLDAMWKDRAFAEKFFSEPPAKLRLFKRICEVVQVAHRKGITHRDLSPSNILIDDRGEPHVLDFGLAATAFDAALSPTGQNVTVTGQFLGKLKYAAPEQAKGDSGDREQIDPRTDVYALGVILYQVLTGGAFPYEVVGNMVDVLNNIVSARPLPPSQLLAARNEATLSITPGKRKAVTRGPVLVNPAIEAVVLRALEKDPAKRYESAGVLAEEINNYLDGRPAKPASVEESGSGEQLTPRKRVFGKKWVAAAIALFLLVGLLMNLRTVCVWLGLTSSLAAFGMAAGGPTTAPSTQASAELTDRQLNLLKQLANTETNIREINRALKMAGYKVGVAYDQIDNAQRGNDRMNRKGGGPVGWQEFYGRTAAEFDSTRDFDRRPQQFDYVYKANDEQAQRARDQIQAIAKNQSALLERRKQHEDEQSRLWAMLAWGDLQDREIGLQPLYRFKLTPDGARAKLLAAPIAFLRAVDSAAAEALEALDGESPDQEKTFKELNQKMSGAYKSLQSELAVLLDGESKKEDATEIKELKALCKRLSEQSANLADNYRKAAEADRNKEDSSKLSFRQELQSSLYTFASTAGVLDERLKKVAGAWEVKGSQNAGAASPPAAGKPTNSASGARQNQTAKSPAGTPGGIDLALDEDFPKVDSLWISPRLKWRHWTENSPVRGNETLRWKNVPKELVGMMRTVPSRQTTSLSIRVTKPTHVYLACASEFLSVESKRSQLQKEGWTRSKLGDNLTPTFELYEKDCLPGEVYTYEVQLSPSGVAPIPILVVPARVLDLEDGVNQNSKDKDKEQKDSDTEIGDSPELASVDRIVLRGVQVDEKKMYSLVEPSKTGRIILPSADGRAFTLRGEMFADASDAVPHSVSFSCRNFHGSWYSFGQVMLMKDITYNGRHVNGKSGLPKIKVDKGRWLAFEITMSARSGHVMIDGQTVNLEGPLSTTGLNYILLKGAGAVRNLEYVLKDGEP